MPILNASARKNSNIVPRSWGDWVIIALCCVCAICASNLLWVVFGPVGAVGAWRPTLPVPLSADSRAAIYNGKNPFSPRAASADATQTVTSLALTLFGTRQNQASGSGSAIIAGADGVQKSISVGNEVAPGVILSQVLFDHVLLDRNGVTETLYMDQSKPAQKVGAGIADSNSANAPAPTTSANTAGTNAAGEVAFDGATLGNAIGVAPRTENGRVTGLIVAAKGDGATLRAIGLAPGDIITTINGRPAGSASDFAGIARAGTRVSLEVERGAQKLPIGISIK